MSEPRAGRDVTRTRALAGRRRGCWPWSARSASACGPTSRRRWTLDGAVSEAVYVGDDRAPRAELAPRGAHHPRRRRLPARGLPRGARLADPPPRLAGRRRGCSTAVVLIGPLTSLLKESSGGSAPTSTRAAPGCDSLSYPERAFVRDRDAGDRRADPRVAGPLARAARRVWLAVGVVAVVLVGLTRMWLGVHFLSDVVGGWALGVSWSLLVALVFGALPGGRGALPAGRRARCRRGSAVTRAGAARPAGPGRRVARPAAAAGGGPAAAGRAVRAGTSTGPSTSSRSCWPGSCGTSGRTARTWSPATSRCCGPAPGWSTTRSPGTPARGCSSATCGPPSPAAEPAARGAPRGVGLGGPRPVGRPAVGGPGRARGGGGGAARPAGRARDGRRPRRAAGRPHGRRSRGWCWSGSWTRPARPGQTPDPPRNSEVRSARPAGAPGLQSRGGCGESGGRACRSAPRTCSPPPTTTPTARSTCAAGCTASPRSGCSCRRPRPPCSMPSRTCRSR